MRVRSVTDSASAVEQSARTVTVGGAELSVATWGADPAEIVILHDGLGSIAQFKGFPQALQRATGKSVLAYDRAGHGTSTPTPSGSWAADWLHAEAGVLDLLLTELGIDKPILVGHSDGGSIALLHAATKPTAVAAVVAIASHSYVEDICFNKITGMRADARVWVEALKQFHRDAAALFEAWSGVWTSAEFRKWDIRSMIEAVSVPTLIVQGSEDEYATAAMATETAAAIGDNARVALVAGGKHLLPQRSEAELVQLLASFLNVRKQHSPQSTESQ